MKRNNKGITRWLAVVIAVVVAAFLVVSAGFSFFGTEAYAKITEADLPSDATGSNVTDISGADAGNGNVAITPHKNEFPLTEERDGKTVTYANAYVTEKGAVIVFTNEVNNYYDINGYKVKLGQGEELAGAELKVTGTDASGNEITPITWTSNGTVREISLDEGEYTLTETSAPDGYIKAESVTFTVDSKGKVIINGNEQSENEIVMEDDYTKVTIKKTDITGGKEIGGAKLQVKDGDKVVEEWTSEEGKSHEINAKLAAGKSYTLVEVNAPEGYQKVTTEIKFTIGEDGEVTLVTTTVEPAGAVKQLDDGTIILSDAAEYVLPRLPGIATTVKAGEKTASEDAACRLTYDETNELTSITDTIYYADLLKGVTYTVTGRVVEIDINESETTDDNTDALKVSAKKSVSGPKTGDDSNAALYITAFAAAAGIALTSVMLRNGKKHRRR